MEKIEKIFKVFEIAGKEAKLTSTKVNEILTSINETPVAPQSLASLAKQGYLKKLDEKCDGKVQYVFITADREEALLSTDGIISNFEDLKIKGTHNTVEECAEILEGSIPYGTIYPDKAHERMNWECFYDENKSVVAGLEYFFIIDGYVLKNGKTDDTMKSRIQSYNCGTFSNRKNGTCSVTNFQVLQSILLINKPVEVRVKFAPMATMIYNGQTISINTSPSRALESIDNKLIEKNGVKFPGCFQK